MSKSKSRKKSTKKYAKFKTSRLIPIIAIIEALVLVGISTYAWYALNANKELSSGIITVEADSGLEIDFAEADKSSYINIFDYVKQEDFYFEPATSVDGRNIYFPTTGTFNKTNTAEMVFRDGTVNDINSKYISIDFTLTNTDSEQYDVYLSNRSFFRISNNNNVTLNGKALRMALYNNDGNSGDVTSHIINSSAGSAAQGAALPQTEDENATTIYFTMPDGFGDDTPTIYLWNYASDQNANVQTIYKHEWPGEKMSKVCGRLYSFTFTNPKDANDNYVYDRVIFKGSDDKTGNLTLNMTNTWYNGSAWAAAPVLQTVYFLCPHSSDKSTAAWNSTPRCAVGTGTTSDTDLDGAFVVGGDPMQKVSEGIYSYTFPNTYHYIQFLSDGLNCKTKILNESTWAENKLYYISGTQDSNNGSGVLKKINYEKGAVYFYNSLNWENPYISVKSFRNSETFQDNAGSYDSIYKFQMVNLSGGLYYAALGTPFLQDLIGNQIQDDSYCDKSNCTVTFYDNSDPTNKTTSAQAANSEIIYRPVNSDGAISVVTENYNSVLDNSASATPYAVISPGVSAGFQRSANPVSTISTAGAATSIIPAFASSFDDYIMGSNKPVFTVGADKTVNMTMIIWLEGTDTHCTAKNYAAKDINLYLEFTTRKVQQAAEDTYTYEVVDATMETWTGDQISSGNVKINPVMQLYDRTTDRGYLMQSKTTSDNKVKVWTCNAPQALLTDSETDTKHFIEFRRVNPYDESMVWNRWEAGYLYDYRDYARSGNTVTFTIFADGSPDYNLYGPEHPRTTTQIEDLPENSCGGLWGDFPSIETLRVYDGRYDRLVVNDNDKTNNEGDALNFGYTYTYPNSNGLTMTIEYKASPVSNHFFELPIPSTAFANASDSYFIHYDKLGPYAINSTDNKTIIACERWEAGTIDGLFYEFNEHYDTSTGTNDSPAVNQHSYWGSDVVYYQIKNSVSNSYSTYNDIVNLAAFYNDDSSKYFEAYLYENDDYLKDNGKHGFAAVVPNDEAYTQYDYRRIVNYSTNDKVQIRYTGASKNSGLNWVVAQADNTNYYKKNYGIRINKVSDNNRLTCIDWDWARLYYQNDAITTTAYNHPGLHTFIGGTSFSEPSGTEWQYGKTYRAFVPSDRTFQFTVQDGNDKKYSTHVQAWTAYGKRYYTAGTWYNNTEFELSPVYDTWNAEDLNEYKIERNYSKDETGASQYSTSWAHYEDKAVKT